MAEEQILEDEVEKTVVTETGNEESETEVVAPDDGHPVKKT